MRAPTLALVLILVTGTTRAEEPPRTPTPARAMEQSVESPWWFKQPPPGQRNAYFEATDPDAELRLRVLDASGKLVWRAVCEHAPCITRVQIGAEYRVSGPGVTNSRVFLVYPNPGGFALRARTGSSTARTAGFLGIGVGSAAMAVGTMWMALNTICWGCTEEEKSRAMAPGVAIFAGGLIALGVGIALAVANGTSLDFGPRALRFFRPVYVPAYTSP